ncbi:metal-dependent hydrolase, partial [Stenotrophomonas sp. A3_2]|uniref:metal-dependent hydrolase n=1 Tax=Stenotrophomonas sp. A3_2 TaxID=3119978 RepID=UPI002FC3D858
MSDDAVTSPALSEAATHGMPIRRMGFLFPPPLDCVFVKNDPWTSYTFLGVWMMLPYLEPYLIRSINEAADRIEDPDLKEECRRFAAQEGHHYREHANANKVVKAMHPGFAALTALEEEVAAEFK